MIGCSTGTQTNYVMYVYIKERVVKRDKSSKPYDEGQLLIPLTCFIASAGLAVRLARLHERRTALGFFLGFGRWKVVNLRLV